MIACSDLDTQLQSRAKTPYSVIPSEQKLVIRALVSVAAALFLFKRRLTDTCVLGNLVQVGKGFVEVHASLREIPEGDEKYGRLSAPYFLPFENDGYI